MPSDVEVQVEGRASSTLVGFCAPTPKGQVVKDQSNLAIAVPDSLIHAVLSQDKVEEPPHSFYKYPARFSPVFAREAIKAFTREGDTVIDPFCGSGTSLVEAIALGRRAAGFDISSLAVFLARAKTTPLSVHDKKEIMEWSRVIASVEQNRVGMGVVATPEAAHYHRHLPEGPKEFFETVIGLSRFLKSQRQQSLVRLALLAVGQWALDCKTRTPTWTELRTRFCEKVGVVVENQYEFVKRVAKSNRIPRWRLSQTRRIINRTSEESGDDGRIPPDWLPARLVLTSPPYPGVHVLYHRWQINGRRETPAPFWLADSRDGAGESYYCLGPRDEPALHTYFERLAKAFISVRDLIDNQSLVVQLVAFSAPEWQLPAYLQKMELAGFSEIRPICDEGYLFEGRIWRDVPGRKWYANQRVKSAAAKEVMLFHRITRR